MASQSLIGNVKDKVELVRNHGQDVVKTGMETLLAAKDVVVGARRDAVIVLQKTRDELRRTFKDGADKIGHKLANIAKPTHKEAAEAKKEEIKAKKRAKRTKSARGGAKAAGAGEEPVTLQ